MQQPSATAPHFKRELLRKLFHLPALCFYPIARYSTSVAIAMLLLAMLIYTALWHYRQRLAVPFFSAFMQRCARTPQFDPAPLYMAIGILVSIQLSLFAHQPFSLFPLYCLAIADSLAALIGMRYGRKKIGSLNKSYAGSITFFCAAWFGIIAFTPPAPISAQWVVALLLTGVELVGVRGLDNILLPVCAQLCVLYWL